MKRLKLKKVLKWTGVVLGGLVAIGLVANALFVWINHYCTKTMIVYLGFVSFLQFLLQPKGSTSGDGSE